MYAAHDYEAILERMLDLGIIERTSSSIHPYRGAYLEDLRQYTKNMAMIEYNRHAGVRLSPMAMNHLTEEFGILWHEGRGRQYDMICTKRKRLAELAGFDPDGLTQEEWHRVMSNYTSAIRTRGPDGAIERMRNCIKTRYPHVKLYDVPDHDYCSQLSPINIPKLQMTFNAVEEYSNGRRDDDRVSDRGLQEVREGVIQEVQEPLRTDQG
jgi:hypothetical protein